MSTSELINQAQAILNSKDIPIDSQLQAIEEYSANFKIFEEANGLESLSPESLQELNDTHAEVLKLATELLGTLSGDLGSLKSRGKAVLNYLDTLPRRISRTRTKKG